MIAFLDLDRENDLLYIALASRLASAKRRVSHSARHGANIVLDFDDAGQLIGIQVMDASKVLNVRDLSLLNKDSFVGVKEAAALVGVEKSNFIRDYARRSDFPKPVVEVASGPIWVRDQIEGFLAHARKQPRIRPKVVETKS